MTRARKLFEKIESLLEIYIPHTPRPFYSENPRVHPDNEFTEGEKIHFNFTLGFYGYTVPVTVQRVTERGVMLNCNGLTCWVPKKGLNKANDKDLDNLYYLETWVKRDEEQKKIFCKMSQYDIYAEKDDLEVPTLAKKWNYPTGKVKEYIKSLEAGDVFLLYLFKKDLNDIESYPFPVKLKVLRTSEKALLVSDAKSPSFYSAAWIPRMAMNICKDGLKLDDIFFIDGKDKSVYKSAYRNSIEKLDTDIEVKSGL